MNRSDLRQVVVVSGKGGTGKTSVTASFAALAGGAVLADCDVDAANLHLLLHPEIQSRREFRGAYAAVRDQDRCRGCGACARHCRFGAITAERIDTRACQGCGVCALACPEKALRLEEIVSGELYASITRYGPMAHARLSPGGESSGKLVTAVRREAEEMALAEGRSLLLLDGPPGIGCAVSASITDTDLVVVVTEPTPSGVHDLERILALIGHFRIPSAVILNKADLDAAGHDAIRECCAAWRTPLLAEIPFDEAVPRAIADGRPPVEGNDSPAAVALCAAWRATRALLP